MSCACGRVHSLVLVIGGFSCWLGSNGMIVEVSCFVAGHTPALADRKGSASADRWLHTAISEMLTICRVIQYKMRSLRSCFAEVLCLDLIVM